MIKRTRHVLIFVIVTSLVFGALFIYFSKPAWWHHGLMGVAHMTGMQGRMHEMMRSDATHDNRSRVREMMGELVPIGVKPELLVDADSTGASTLKRYCAQCHNLPAPKMHTSLEWPAIVSRMKERMVMHGQMMGGIIVPTARELSGLVDYLKSNAIVPFDTSRGMDLGSPAGQVFSRTCSACHGLPDPTKYAAKDWPMIVSRMQANMKVMGKKPIGDSESQMLIEYLQAQSMAGQNRGVQ